MKRSIRVCLALLGGISAGYLLRSCFIVDNRTPVVHNDSVSKEEDSFTPEEIKPADQTSGDVAQKQLKRFSSRTLVPRTLSCTPNAVAANAPKQETLTERSKGQLAQITLTNSSDKEKDVALWGIEGIKSAPSPEEASQPLASIPITGVQPQGLVINPYNNLVYVANQLSDTVTITTVEGGLVKTVLLNSSNFPGLTSPVQLAVQTYAGHSSYGSVYVVGSVSDTVSIIDQTVTLKKALPVGRRPVAIAFNKHNNFMYVANLASNNVTVIDVVTEQVVNSLLVGKNPRAIGVNAENGDVYVANSGDNTLTVFDKNNVAVSLVALPGSYPVALTWHPGKHQMFAVAALSNEVIAIDANTYSVQQRVHVGNAPYAAAYHPGNGYLYVANRDDQSLTIIANDNSVYATVPAANINNGVVIHPDTYALLWTTTSLNGMELTVPPALSPSIITDVQNIMRLNNYFRYNMVELQQVKFVFPGENYLMHFTLRQSTAMGKRKDTSIALSNYYSPQQFLKVFDIQALKGLNMNGNVRWIFKLPPKQTITMLMHYKAFEKDQLLDRAS